MLENNKLITDFKLKANLFNDFFNQQCTTEDNPSSVPEHMSFETVLFIYLFIYLFKLYLPLVNKNSFR